MNECIVCNKKLPEPIMVCFDCTTNKSAEVFKALEKLGIEMAKKRKSREPLQ